MADVSGLRLKLEAGKRTVAVTEDRIALGRDASVQVVVKDRSVSRKHAVIERRGDAWFVVDQGSSNGTFLDGMRVTDAPLADGQELRLGMVALQVELEAPPDDATVVMQMGGPREMATVLMTPPGRPRAAAAPVAVAAPAPERAATEQATAPDDVRDLPSAQPVVVDDALASVFMQQSAPAAAGPAHASDLGLHVMTKILGSAAIVFISLALFFVIGMGKLREQATKVQQSPEYVKARREAETYRPTADLVTAGALVNRRLAICNVGAQPLRVSWLAAIHVETGGQDANGARVYQAAKFHSGYCGSAFDVVIEPGATRTLSFSAANERCQWHGAGVFFGLSTAPAATATETPQTVWYAGVPGGEASCLKIGAAS